LKRAHTQELSAYDLVAKRGLPTIGWQQKTGEDNAMSKLPFDRDEVVVCGVIALCLGNAALGIIYRLMAYGAGNGREVLRVVTAPRRADRRRKPENRRFNQPRFPKAQELATPLA
jgi:hypothetical protein